MTPENVPSTISQKLSTLKGGYSFDLQEKALHDHFFSIFKIF